MGATPEDTEREIVRLRGDMTAAVEEVERRLRGGVRGIATSEARIGSARAGENALSRARENPTLLGVVGVVAAGAVAYGVYALINGRRESQKPQNRLKRGVAELSERVTEGVESSRHQLERALPHGVLLKLEPESGGYMRVSDARLDAPPAIRKKRGQSLVLKRFVWAGFLSVFLAVASVLARRVADSVWRAMVHEEPPTEKGKAPS
ncbi:MAG: hypothetical protein JO020_02540 [Chloroflexi bacterium]|nr:hypothetical protein [Chloroflexota bacterium]MBV9893028.1 hypothetical protein [Chloroflexota bacterium]